MHAISTSQRRVSRSPWLPHVPRTLWAVLGIALLLAAGLDLRAALETPGEAIRSELEAAAADLRTPAPAASEPALTRLHRHFRDRDATIDVAFWPLVSVTLHHLDAATCRDAAAKAGRIEGAVVIALEHYRTEDACRGANDMTWRIMP